MGEDLPRGNGDVEVLVVAGTVGGVTGPVRDVVTSPHRAPRRPS